MLKFDNERGTVFVDNNVITCIVSMVASNCFGIAGMASRGSRNTTKEIWGLLKKDSNEKGIYVSCEDGDISVELHIMVTYGINIPAIVDSICNKVRYSIEETTGFDVKHVKIFVDSIQSK